jgi:hypothetical protein
MDQRGSKSGHTASPRNEYQHDPGVQMMLGEMRIDPISPGNRGGQRNDIQKSKRERQMPDSSTTTSSLTGS